LILGPLLFFCPLKFFFLILRQVVDSSGGRRTGCSGRNKVKGLEAVFFEISDDQLSITALVFERLLTLALFLILFLALDT
jgi:hypothetical protein